MPTVRSSIKTAVHGRLLNLWMLWLGVSMQGSCQLHFLKLSKMNQKNFLPRKAFLHSILFLGEKNNNNCDLQIQSNERAFPNETILTRFFVGKLVFSVWLYYTSLPHFFFFFLTFFFYNKIVPVVYLYVIMDCISL